MYAVTLTVPAQPSLNGGDTLEIDIFAPAGQQFVISSPLGGPNHFFHFFVFNDSISQPTLVAPSSTSVVGQTLSGTIAFSPVPMPAAKSATSIIVMFGPPLFKRTTSPGLNCGILALLY